MLDPPVRLEEEESIRKIVSAVWEHDGQIARSFCRQGVDVLPLSIFYEFQCFVHNLISTLPTVELSGLS